MNWKQKPSQNESLYKKYNQEEKDIQRRGHQKPIRHRKGEVPQWLSAKNEDKNQNQISNVQDKPPENSKIKYVGFTADGVGMVIQTQPSKNIQNHKQEEDNILDDEIFNQKEEDQPQIYENNKNDNGLESNSENESNSDSEMSKSESSSSNNEIVLKKPVYVPRGQREAIYGGTTLMDKARMKEINDQELEEKMKNEIKSYNQIKLANSILEDLKQDELKQNQVQLNTVDDENQFQMPFQDGEDEDQDYLRSELAREKWKLREITRIKRDLLEKQQYLNQLNHNMTDDQEQVEEKSQSQKKQNVAYNFMQKYYHKGAFYQNSEEEEDFDMHRDTTNEIKTSYKSIFKRDFNMPTLEDKVDKSVMPSLLQKRMGTFGRKGQSKWTHLTNEDTTNFNPDTRVNENIAKAQLSKMGGFLKEKEINFGKKLKK